MSIRLYPLAKPDLSKIMIPAAVAIYSYYSNNYVGQA